MVERARAAAAQIFGIKYGLRGFYDRSHKPVHLTPEIVDGIQLRGGTILVGAAPSPPSPRRGGCNCAVIPARSDTSAFVSPRRAAAVLSAARCRAQRRHWRYHVLDRHLLPVSPAGDSLQISRSDTVRSAVMVQYEGVQRLVWTAGRVRAAAPCCFVVTFAITPRRHGKRPALPAPRVTERLVYRGSMGAPGLRSTIYRPVVF